MEHVSKNRHGWVGVPLGGIGAGKVEYTPLGEFAHLTTNNNWDLPVSGFFPDFKGTKSIGGIKGAFFAFWEEGAGHWVLKTSAPSVLNPVEPSNFEFEGRFPVVYQKFKNLGRISLELTAFSPLILSSPSSRYKDSSLPGAVFVFKMFNRMSAPIKASILFSWENLCGVGGYAPNAYICNRKGNRSEYFSGEFHGIHFYTDSFGKDPRVVGEYVIAVLPVPEAEVSYICDWDAAGSGFELLCFAEKGTLPSKRVESEVKPEILASALCVKVEMLPNSVKEIPFALSWFFPHLIAKHNRKVDYGHAYQNWFSNAKEVAVYLLKNYRELLAQTEYWHKFLLFSGASQELSELCINNTFPVFSNSWYTKGFDFSINESPTDMAGCMGTIDQRSATVNFYATFFPGLNASELRLFKKHQVSDDSPIRFGTHWANGGFNHRLDRIGAIPHDVGWDDLEGTRNHGPNWLTLHWPDTNSVYVLQVYHHYITTGDENFLKEFYSSVKRCLEFIARLDLDGDGIPDLWGKGSTTFDTSEHAQFGASSFVASVWIAALEAGKKMAQKFKDIEFVNWIEKNLVKARQTYENELWDEELGYFIFWRKNRVEKSESCFFAQLAGEWFAQLLFLPSVASEGKIKSALLKIYKNNVEPTPGVPANEVAPNGKRSYGWFGYALSYLASLLIYKGFYKEGWEVLKRIYRAWKKDAALWDTPIMWGGDGGKNMKPYWGKWYMSSLAPWAFLQAVSGITYSIPDKSIKIFPGYYQNGEPIKEFPFFTTFCWGYISYYPGQKIELNIKKWTGFLEEIVFEKICTPFGKNFELRIDKRPTDLLIIKRETKSIEIICGCG